MEAEPPFPQGLLEEGSEEAAVLAGVAKKQDRAPSEAKAWRAA